MLNLPGHEAENSSGFDSRHVVVDVGGQDGGIFQLAQPAPPVHCYPTGMDPLAICSGNRVNRVTHCACIIYAKICTVYIYMIIYAYVRVSKILNQNVVP